MIWNPGHILECAEKTGEMLLTDPLSLENYSRDFGKLLHARPAVLAMPESIHALQRLVSYAATHKLPLTIRGKGLSQRGQSLPVEDGMTLSMEKITDVDKVDGSIIWADANASWADVLAESLKEKKVPPVLPYNCHLSVGGVLSAGGIGASSFKAGPSVSQVEALEVLTSFGELVHLDKKSELFHACLGGQGRFALITRAALNLRPCLSSVRTFFLLYTDKEKWLFDMETFKNNADYLECFCSPSVQGSRLTAAGRMPFAEWFYALQVTVEYNEKAPALTDIHAAARPFKTLGFQDEPLADFLLRHDGRFKSMKLSGQWDLPHLWYECFVTKQQLQDNLDDILQSLPIFYANIVQVVPVKNPDQTGFFMLPEAPDCFALMILNPGLPEALLPPCLGAMKNLDSRFLAGGGKRYLSGYLGEVSDKDWQRHFAGAYKSWQEMKKKWDPYGIFVSRGNS